MKKKWWKGIVVVLLILTVSCSENENYSLSDYWVGFGVLKVESDNYLIYMDDGSLLKPVVWTIPVWDNTEWKDGARILVNFTILDDVTNENEDVEKYLVKINEVQKILMKDVLDLTDENADSIGNDPIEVQDYWMTDSLINFKLRYWGYNEVHYLNLVHEQDSVIDGLLNLELRHNANNDEESITYTAYVSFSLNKFRIAESDSVEFQVTSIDYDGETNTFQEVFNYKDLE